MGLRFTDQHIESYYRRGYVVFRGIIPPALIEDLRRVTDQGRGLVRAKHGPQAQRFQPVGAFDIDQQPFQDYAQLPELRQAIAGIIGHDSFFYGNRTLLGVLIEPEELPWCTNWHRDWRDHVPSYSIEEWNEIFLDLEFMNQINCALYKDHCTWVVPGSHLRQNLPRELERFPERPVPGPELEGKSYAERERIGLEYCRSMPGAEQLYLEAGDFAMYRASMWHLGNYVPYSKRASLHDAVLTPRSGAWRARVIGGPGADENMSASNGATANGHEEPRRFVGIRTRGGGEEYRKYQNK
jgi:hypothetical protein